MRSTICTSLALALAAAQAGAQPTPGCYHRAYDAAHLAAHPDQVVETIWLNAFVADGSEGMNEIPGEVLAGLSVVLADQGHVARTPAPDDGFPDGFGGETMDQVFFCRDDGLTCRAFCGEGPGPEGFNVIADDGKTLTIRTDALMVGMGQACGGFTDIAEVPGQPVTFVLDRVDDAVCEPD